MTVYGSILGERFQQLTSVQRGRTSDTALAFDCLLVDNAYAGPIASFRGIRAAAPYGLLGNDRRPASGTTSPGVDYCDGSIAAPLGGDLDGNIVTVDSPRANVHGIRDLGAFEFTPGITDSVFANGFE